MIERPKFSDFAVTLNNGILPGKKIQIKDIIDKEILITGYRLSKSKFNNDKGDSTLLTIQCKVDNELRVFFTSSTVIIDQVKQYEDKIPFYTTIVTMGRCYSLS